VSTPCSPNFQKEEKNFLVSTPNFVPPRLYFRRFYWW